MFGYSQLTNEEPHIRPAVQVLLVHFAQHPSSGHHVEQANDDASVLASQILDGVRRIGQERLSCDDFDARFFAPVFKVFDGLGIEGGNSGEKKPLIRVLYCLYFLFNSLNSILHTLIVNISMYVLKSLLKHHLLRYIPIHNSNHEGPPHYYDLGRAP